MRVLLVVLVLLSAACGSQTDPEAAAHDAATASAMDRVGAASETPQPTPAATPAPDATPAPAPAVAATEGDDDPYPDLAPGESAKIWGEMPLEMSLEPSCATVGTPMKAVIRTVPDALIGGAVRYSDNDPHDDLTFGRAATGEWVWTWTIKPEVPEGLAEAMVTAGKKGESGAAVMAAFEVRRAC